MNINDGAGSNRKASVNPENMLNVCAVTQTVEHHVNHALGKAYMATFEVSATGADDCVFYLKNNDDEDLIIEGFWLYVSKACEVYMKLNDEGTPSGTTTITPVNLNTKSGLNADADCYKGNDITGLSGGSTIIRLKYTSETDTYYSNFDQDVVIGENDAFTVYLDTAGTNLIMSLPFNFHTKCQ